MGGFHTILENLKIMYKKYGLVLVIGGWMLELYI
jgi:hypothetical protein